MQPPRDPEARAHEREQATHGTFEVVLIHDEHGELGTLDREFHTDIQAGYAAHDATISDVGIHAEVQELTE